MPFLYGGLWHLGVSGGPLLPNIPAVGHAGAFGAAGRSDHHRTAGVLLVRDRPQHGGADLTLCVRRSHPLRPEFSHQLGRADV